MAQVYKRVKGLPIQKFMAKHETVQAELAERAFEIGVRAEADLATHHHDGHAHIDIEHGKVDWYIILNDERGQKAAMSIEYGRQPDENGNGGMEGLMILHKAAHLRKGR